jgi:hypothetical protein
VIPHFGAIGRSEHVKESDTTLAKTPRREDMRKESWVFTLTLRLGAFAKDSFTSIPRTISATRPSAVDWALFELRRWTACEDRPTRSSIEN